MIKIIIKPYHILCWTYFLLFATKNVAIRSVVFDLQWNICWSRKSNFNLIDDVTNGLCLAFANKKN